MNQLIEIFMNRDEMSKSDANTEVRRERSELS